MEVLGFLSDCSFGLYSNWKNPELFKMSLLGCDGYVLFCFEFSAVNWRSHQNVAPYEMHTPP